MEESTPACSDCHNLLSRATSKSALAHQSQSKSPPSALLPILREAEPGRREEKLSKLKA